MFRKQQLFHLHLHWLQIIPLIQMIMTLQTIKIILTVVLKGQKTVLEKLIRQEILMGKLPFKKQLTQYNLLQIIHR